MMKKTATKRRVLSLQRKARKVQMMTMKILKTTKIPTKKKIQKILTMTTKKILKMENLKKKKSQMMKTNTI